MNIQLFHLIAFALIMLFGLSVIIMTFYISRHHMKVMDRIVHGREFIVDDIFYKAMRISYYMAMFIRKRNREGQRREVQEKVMALDKAFRRPFIIYFWVIAIGGVLLLATYLLDTFFITPSG